MYHKIKNHLIAKDIFLVGKKAKYLSNSAQYIIGKHNLSLVTTNIYDYTRTTQLYHPKFGTNLAQYMGSTLQLLKFAKWWTEKKLLAVLSGLPSYKNVPYVRALQKKMFIIKVQDHKANFFLKCDIVTCQETDLNHLVIFFFQKCAL